MVRVQAHVQLYCCKFFDISGCAERLPKLAILVFLCEKKKSILKPMLMACCYLKVSSCYSGKENGDNLSNQNEFGIRLVNLVWQPKIPMCIPHRLWSAQSKLTWSEILVTCMCKRHVCIKF